MNGLTSFSDTIFALASAPGRAGVQVLRLSGPQAGAMLRLLAGDLPRPREAALAALRADGVLIDRALVLWFPTPRSFTGEDVAELHLHGGRAILKAVTDILLAQPGVRLARPGEFTRRAFGNGKMDLTEAEAIADLVDAETEAQRRQAMRQFEGELGVLYAGWTARLKKITAHSEALIDFAEEDLPPDLAARQAAGIAALAEEIEAHLADAHRGERLRDGLYVALLGAPNAGKSSLLNALAKREAAIVSPIAGTTRDVIEVALDIGGYPVTFADTAGLREAAEGIEKEGIRRSLDRAEKADLRILLFDATQTPLFDPTTDGLGGANSFYVVNKQDLVAPAVGRGDGSREKPLHLSAKTGAGVGDLIEDLKLLLETRFAPGASPVLTRARHREALEEGAAALRRSLQAADERRAEDLRLALRSLGRLTGQVGVEDLLDMIFREFCIGK